jgi:hypothetical protein
LYIYKKLLLKYVVPADGEALCDIGNVNELDGNINNEPVIDTLPDILTALLSNIVSMSTGVLFCTKRVLVADVAPDPRI